MTKYQLEVHKDGAVLFAGETHEIGVALSLYNQLKMKSHYDGTTVALYRNGVGIKKTHLLQELGVIPDETGGQLRRHVAQNIGRSGQRHPKLEI